MSIKPIEDQGRLVTLLRDAWAANPDLMLGELVHVAAIRTDPSVASSWASGSLAPGLESLIARPWTAEERVIRRDHPEAIPALDLAPQPAPLPEGWPEDYHLSKSGHGYTLRYDGPHRPTLLGSIERLGWGGAAGQWAIEDLEVCWSWTTPEEAIPLLRALAWAIAGHTPPAETWQARAEEADHAVTGEEDSARIAELEDEVERLQAALDAERRAHRGTAQQARPPSRLRWLVQVAVDLVRPERVER